MTGLIFTVNMSYNINHNQTELDETRLELKAIRKLVKIPSINNTCQHETLKSQDKSL